MRAVVVMYDTLSRRFLPPYGNDWVHAPNFQRLADRATVFDNCYAGSMPCMPARRELHTGRHNFLHRSWGQLEPFDDSVPEMLDRAGMHTHLVTDHKHYWDDHSATYHPRFSTYEFIRGQQGDRWIGDVAALRGGTGTGADDAEARRHQRTSTQDKVNRREMPTEDKHHQTQVFDRGLEFISRNAGEDGWFLQIETFDPHEPFFTYDDYRDLYPRMADGTAANAMLYNPVSQSPEEVQDIRRQYAALLSQCDKSLGRVLDAFDEHDLWADTMLIICTDHGFLLGEHGWWGKRVQPWYDEAIHTPLLIWDPAGGAAGAGQHRDSLVQTIDIAPTLLAHFGLAPTPDMQGRPLQSTVVDDRPVHDGALFGAFGTHVNVTDGRYVYMRGTPDPANSPLFEYTLSPVRIGPRMYEDLRHAELVPPLPFTKGAPVLKIPAQARFPFIYGMNPAVFGTLLFDLETDPDQQHPLVDDEVELRMAELLVRLMRESDAQADQFERVGLPAQGPVGPEHLLARAQHEVAVATTLAPGEYAARLGLNTPIRDLLADPAAAQVLRRHLPDVRPNPFSPIQHAVLATGEVTMDVLPALAADLADLEKAAV